MLAVVWSLVGLLAVALGLLATALLSGLSRLDARIDVLGSDLRGEIRDEIRQLRDVDLRQIRDDIRDVREAVQRLDVRLTTAGG